MESLGTVGDARKAIEEAKRMIAEAEKLLQGTRKSNSGKIMEAAIMVQRVSAKTSMAGRILTVFANEAKSKAMAKKIRTVGHGKGKKRKISKKRSIQKKRGGKRV